MIRSILPVLAISRSGKLAVVYVEIFNEENDINNNQYIFIIRDYIINQDGSQYEINRKEVKIPYSVRDGLKQLIISQNRIEGSESEINNQIRPYALLYYIQNDFVSENNKCIYMTNQSDWEIV